MKIVIADDHPLYREALVARIQRIFPEAAVAEANSFDEAAAEAERDPEHPALFLLDYNMPGATLDAVHALVHAYPASRIAVISGSAEVEQVRGVVCAGAHGFIPKTAAAEYLQHALQMLLAGGTSVPAEFLAGMPAAPAPAPDLESRPAWAKHLTEREVEVMAGLVRGLSNKEIGRELNLAEVTVKLHVSGIFRKTGARSRAEAAVLASRTQLGHHAAEPQSKAG